MVKRKTINQAVTVSKQPIPEDAAHRTRKTINTSALIAAQVGEAREPKESGDRVTVTIPKAFTLTLENHHQVHYPAGVDEMPLEHANHWYTKAMGVEIYEGK